MIKNKLLATFTQHKIYLSRMSSCVALGLSLGFGQLQAAPEFESTTTQPKADEAKWFTDFEAAKKLAAKENRPILLFITGSDWCFYCKVLKKDVFDKEEFLKGVKNKWVLMEVDLPSDKTKISAETLKQNNLIKDYFEVTGLPRVLALSPDAKPLSSIGRTEDPASYLKRLDTYLDVVADFKKRMEAAEKAEGEAKAVALIKALKLISKNYVHFHTESINVLEKLAEKGQAKAAASLLGDLSQRKETMAAEAESRIMDPEFEKLGKMGWMKDLEAAKAKATKEGKYLFIHFLKPSKGKVKTLLNNVYYQPEFKMRTEKDWVLVEIDYEHEREVEKRTPQYEKNKALWDSYGAQIYWTVSACAFPDGRPFSINPYWGKKRTVEVDELLDYLDAKKKEGDEFVELLKLAETSEGEERAVLLDKFFYPHFKYRLERRSDFNEEYSREIALLVEADPGANQRVTKIFLLSQPKLKELFEAKGKIGGWTEIGKIAARYFNEHDSSEFPKLRCKLFKLQAYAYAYQGMKKESDEAVASLLSKELRNTPGYHSAYKSEKEVVSLKKKVATALAMGLKHKSE